MAIEDYWVDSVLYYVEFISLDGRKITKELIFPMDVSESQLRKFVHTSFFNVKKVKRIDHVSEVLSIKDPEGCR